MRTLPSGLATHIQQDLTTLCLLWTVTLQNGAVYRFTSADIVVQDSTGNSYTPGIQDDDSAVTMKLDMSVGNSQISGFYVTGTIALAQVAGGLWAGARVKVWVSNWANPSDGQMKEIGGWIGKIQRSGNGYKMEFRSTNQALQLQVCSITASSCRSLFGDLGIGSAGGCRYPTNPPVWSASLVVSADYSYQQHVVPTVANGFQYVCIQSGTTGGTQPTWPTSIGSTVTDGGVIWQAVGAIIRTGTIGTVTDNKNFTVTSVPGVFTGGASSQGFFMPGFVRGVTGLNATVKQDILSIAVAGSTVTVKLMNPMPFTLAPGDSVQLIASCDKQRDTCIAYMNQGFRNWYNFRGEADIPGADALFPIAGYGKKG